MRTKVSAKFWAEFLSAAIILTNASLDRRRSMTQGFVIITGGFHLFERSSEERSSTQNLSQEDNDSLHPLLASDLVHDDIYLFPIPT